MTCERCGKRKDFAEKCKTTTGNGCKNINTVEDESEYSSSEEEILTVISETVNSVKESKYKTKVFATIEIAGKHVQFQVDPGATCNLIPERVLPSDSEIINEKPMLTMYNESSVKAVRMSKLRMRNQQTRKKYVAHFLLLSQGKPLLGPRAAQQMGLIQIVKWKHTCHWKPEENPAHSRKHNGAIPRRIRRRWRTGRTHPPRDRQERRAQQTTDQEDTRHAQRWVERRTQTDGEAWHNRERRNPNGIGITTTLSTTHFQQWMMHSRNSQEHSGSSLQCVGCKINGYWHVELDKESNYITTLQLLAALPLGDTVGWESCSAYSRHQNTSRRNLIRLSKAYLAQDQ